MNSLYDVYLGDVASLQGYRCKSFLRDSAPLVSARFSSGQQGESDLDLLKSFSLDSVVGGMFQREFTDTQKVARGIGVLNKYDENLYPAPARGSATAVSGGYYPQAKAESDAVSFIAYGAFSAGTYYNLLYMMTYGGGYSSVTLPAALQNNGFANISSLVLHKKYLFVASENVAGHANCHRYDIDAGTWQDITGYLTKFFTLRNLLYGINRTGDVYSVTNETAAGAATYTAVTVAGSASLNAFTTDAVEYNGAAYISKYDGIFRFDGTNATRILNLFTNQMKVFNGALYFAAGQWLYKFDGTNVTRLQFFGNQEIIGGAYGEGLALSANSDYLYIATVVLTSGYTSGDKVGTFASGLRRIYTYDAVGFLLLNENSETLGTGYCPALISVYKGLYDVFGTNGSGSWATNWYKFTLTDFYDSTVVTSSSKLEVTLSEFNDSFPNIFKALEIIDANYTGMISGDSIVVSYQYYDGRTWSSWITAGTLTSTTDNRIEIAGSTQKLFKRLRVNYTATLAAGSTLALKGGSLRYTLQPRMRWRWQITLIASGNGVTTDRAGTAIATDSNALTNTVTKAIKQKTPLFMLAPDYSIVDAQINNSALSIVIKGQIPIYTDPYNEYPFVAVKNNSGVWEVLRISAVSYNGGTDKTTLTIIERGYYGVTAAQINAGAEFHLAYKVYVTRLLREQTILDENTYAEQSGGESQLQREYMLEVTEV